ncbi:MAG: RidA family protein [Candidatus Zixiibacteriota bacterium]
MTHKAMTPPEAPAAVGPYSPAVLHEETKTLYVSGQIPLDPDTGEIVGDDIETQTRQALTNLKAVLEGSGSGMDRVLKCTVLMTNLGDFAKMNAVYGTFFPGVKPARAAFQVGALPKGAQVEIEAIATVG